MDEFLITFLLFIIYSCIGWLCEVLYCSALEKKIVNRGFLIGPYCPIYGFGALAVTKLLGPFISSPLSMFLAAVVIINLLEYVTGYLLETIFHLKWWDYSQYRFNIDGRVVLHNSLIFGVLSLIAVYRLNPFLIDLVNGLSFQEQMTLGSGLFIILISDTVVSVINILQLNGKLAKIHLIAEELRERQHSYVEGIIKETESKLEEFITREIQNRKALKERIELLGSRLEELHINNKALHRRIILAFPNIRSKVHPDSLNSLKDKINKSDQKG